MPNDFEIKQTSKTRRSNNEIEFVDGEVVGAPKKNGTSGQERLVNAVADNFDRIVDIASTIAEINRMGVAAEARRKELEEERKLLVAEAEAYVNILNAKTHSIISKAEILRMMMQDYYRYGKDRLSSEEFSGIIHEVIAQFGDQL